MAFNLNNTQFKEIQLIQFIDQQKVAKKVANT